MTILKSMTEIDSSEMIDHVYKEGSYEKHWTGTRYKLVVDGFAHGCSNSWTVDIESMADLLDPQTAAHRLVIEEADGLPPHRNMTQVRRWDAKEGSFFEIA